jgi:polysaccharide transporter, PST family
VRGGLALIIGNGVNRVIGFVIAAVLARQLSIDDFGTYAFAMAFGGFFTMFTDLGLNSVTTRELARRDDAADGAILASALAVKGAITALAMVAAAAGILLFDHDLRVAAVIAATNTAMVVPGTLGLVLTARMRMVPPLVVQVTTSLLTLGTMAVALGRGAGPVALVSISVAGTLVASLALVPLGRGALVGKLAPDRALMRVLVKDTAPLAVAAVAGVLYRRIDQLMLGGLADVSAVAHYSSAVRLVDALNLLPFAAAMVTLPTLSRLQRHRAGDTRSTQVVAVGQRLLSASLLPIAALGTAAGGTGLALAFGETYRGASTVLAILLWAHFFGFAGVMLQQLLIVRDQVRPLAVLTVAGAVVNVVINLWAIPRHGAEGAAWASLAAYSVPILGGMFWPGVSDAFRLCVRSSMRPAMASLLVLAALWTVDPSPRHLLPVFAVATTGALLLTRSTSLTELSRLLGHLRASRATAVRHP